MRFTKLFSDLTPSGFWWVTTALLTALATPGLAQSMAVQNGDTIAFMGDSITEGGWGSPVGYVRLVWMDIPNGVSLSGRHALSMKQFERLKALADQRKLSVPQLVDGEFSGTISNLLKTAPQ